MRYLTIPFVCVGCFVVICSICFYLKYRHVAILKEARMEQLSFSLSDISYAIGRIELSKSDSVSDDNRMLYEFYYGIELLDCCNQIKHVLSHFDDTTLIPPRLLSTRAYQYKGIDGIICLHVTYIEEGFLTEEISITFKDNVVFLKDARLYLESQYYKTHPWSLKENPGGAFGYVRRVSFFLYTENQSDQIEAFLYPYMREIGCLDWYISKISDENVEEIMQSHVKVNLILSDGTHSNSELLKLFPIRLSVSEGSVE